MPFDRFATVPPLVLAALLFGAGVVFLLFGWHIYRILLVVVGVLIGGAMGAGLAALFRMPALLFALPLGIIAGLLALKLEKVGAFLAGGLCGAIPLLAVRAMFDPLWGAYAAAGLAFVLGGIITVFLWRPMIVVSMAVIGAAGVANGVLMAAGVFSPGVERLASTHPYITAGCVAALTVFGVLFQTRGEEEE